MRDSLNCNVECYFEFCGFFLLSRSMIECWDRHKDLKWVCSKCSFLLTNKRSQPMDGLLTLWKPLFIVLATASVLCSHIIPATRAMSPPGAHSLCFATNMRKLYHIIYSGVCAGRWFKTSNYNHCPLFSNSWPLTMLSGARWPRI